ncbi:hypothetical protein D3C81_1183850 [compost metagenome]
MAVRSDIEPINMSRPLTSEPMLSAFFGLVMRTSPPAMPSSLPLSSCRLSEPPSTARISSRAVSSTPPFSERSVTRLEDAAKRLPSATSMRMRSPL